AVGVYGVTSFAIGQRSREIAVRMAVGARTTDVLAMVVGETFRLAIAGIALGIAFAFVLTRAMTALLYGISPTDLPTFAGASIGILIITLLACYLPARKAATVDPIIALK